jgi:ABC-2 type transport system permease protein
MSATITLATAHRVLVQLLHDRRTVALVVALPAIELTLLRLVLDADPAVFDRWAVPLLGVFPLITMFLVTSVAMLRERTSGTLERLLTTPLHKLDLLGGYGIAFALAATAQAVITCGVAYGPLGLQTTGSAWLVVAIAVANALLGMALGLFTSAFARSEFQATQLLPAVVVPQLLLCGLIWPRNKMAPALEAISNLLPMTYTINALTEVTRHATATGALWRNLSIVALCAVAALLLGALTLRRRTP